MHPPADDELDFEGDDPQPPPPPDFEVDVGDSQGHVAIDRDAVRALVERVLRGEGVAAASISVAFVDDPTIHRVNREHLAHDEPTDVITFLLSDEDDERLSGEVVVSAQTAARVAAEVGVEPWNEVALYVVHGLLHLCGCDDLDEASAAEMRAREDAALARVGLANPFLPAGRRTSP
ncbi:rRNA maturation RNase YbeY [Paludisphaera mucosa]|uniref:Endoribonuclease YbeY n=1 Tax=Paludisphaera mucosa TaxID=3030827 RepID=A0ABT6FG64_9BACT|nr:rRNA maturation RNase YbeY [Paludisphaera mucosa]MDG3006560.1 rRNA maturation RNase YbeY [Paludisphaera mucosa]